MELLKFVRLIVILVPMVVGKYMTSEEIKAAVSRNEHLTSVDPRHGVELCARLSKEPYFGVEMLLGKAWRIYYSWNIDLRDQCLDMWFRNVTEKVVNRFFMNMNEYLESWPIWNATRVLVRMGRLDHQILLFAEEGAAGTFAGVPQFVRHGSISPTKRTVPLLKFHFKLMHGGKYLLIADCQLGVTTLSSRRNKLPNRGEIDGIVSIVDIGPGHHACLRDKNKN